MKRAEKNNGESLADRVARLGPEALERLAERLSTEGAAETPNEASGRGRHRPTGERSENEHKILVAYYVTRTGTPLAPDELSSFLRGSLPDHLVPTVFSRIDEIPRTKRGKVDKARLPHPFSPPAARPSGSGESGASQTETERHLIEIWRAVLGVDRIVEGDSFFEIGGDSLLGIQLLGRIRDRWQTEVTMEALFDHARLREMASYIEAIRWARRSNELGDGDGSDKGDREEIEF